MTAASSRIREPFLLAAAGALFVALFHYAGNASNVAMEGRSVFAWLLAQWTLPNGDFSHAWLMPLVSAGFLLRDRRALARAPKQVSLGGLLATAGLLLLHVAAFRAQQPRLSAMAMAGLLWAIPCALYGREVGRLLLFPCAYLLLCIASYFLVTFTFKLRLMASGLAGALLNGVGIAAVRSGTAIYSAAGGGFHFDVADPCSGLRSLVVMTALAAPYAYLTQPTVWRRWALFLCAVPLAVIANAVRIVTVALVAEGFGQDVAMRMYHDYSGYLVFVIATILLMATGRLIEKCRLPSRVSWTPNASKPTSPSSPA